MSGRVLGAIPTLLIAIACAGSPAAPVDTDHAMVAWTNDRTCKSDADCVMVDDCCPCSAGGSRIGVSASARTAVEARRAEACSTDNSVAEPGAERVTPVACTQTVRTTGPCAPSAHAVCRDGMCRVVE